MKKRTPRVIVRDSGEAEKLRAELVEMRKSRDQFRENAKFYREQAEQGANNLMYAEDKASECISLKRGLREAHTRNFELRVWYARDLKERQAQNAADYKRRASEVREFQADKERWQLAATVIGALLVATWVCVYVASTL